MSEEKALVRGHFARSRMTYDRSAVAQEEIARRLGGMIDPIVGGTVLEIGCGTGFLSALLVERLPGCHFVFNDLSPAMEEPLRMKVGALGDFLPGDAELLPWPSDCRLVASASCIQWWQDPTSFYRKAFEALSRGGRVLFSTFLPDNLHELRAVTGVGLKYLDRAEIEEAVRSAGFREVRLEEYRRTLHFPTLTELLRHLKQTGTNGITSEGPWTAGRLRALEQEYRERLRLSSTDDLPLTYVGLLGRGRR